MSQMRRLTGERNIEWLGRINTRLAEIEAALAELPPDENPRVSPGQEYPRSDNPREALLDEQDSLSNHRLLAAEGAKRDGDL